MPPKRLPDLRQPHLIAGDPAGPQHMVTAGIDEAGRGCLAGPVVAAAVILPEEYDLPGLNDSKALTAAQREALAPAIKSNAIAWGLGVIWPRTIEEINILQATLLGMTRAVLALRTRPHLLLVDGNTKIPELLLRRFWGEEPLPRQQTLVHGDALEPAISAASILAKTFRDTLMEHLDARYPGYGLSKHKGYGTQEHLDALRRLGPSRLHRTTFRGVLPDAPATPQQGSLC